MATTSSCSRAFLFSLVALATSSVGAALIRYDLRAVQNGTIGATVHDVKYVQVGAPSGVVKMQVWAMVEDANRNREDDGFARTMLSFLSGTNGLRGDLRSANVAPFDVFPSEPGSQFDLDGDGDIDIGQNEPTDNPNRFFVPFAGLSPLPGPLKLWADFPDSAKTGEVVNGQVFSSFLIGSLEFAFDLVDLTSGPSTVIAVRPRNKTDGMPATWTMHSFMQDGQRVHLPGSDSGVVAGLGVHLTTVGSAAVVPEPGTWLLAAVGAVGILAWCRCKKR